MKNVDIQVVLGRCPNLGKHYVALLSRAFFSHDSPDTRMNDPAHSNPGKAIHPLSVGYFVNEHRASAKFLQ
jgi:hypothetical protein